MANIDLGAWAEEEENPDRRRFREALHVLLYAIASSPELRMTAVMKGGILMAIRHGSSRFTRDIDFSSRQLARDFDVDKFLSTMKDQLANAVDSLSYDIECIVQSHEMRPARSDATHPTLQVRIGYAPRSDERALRRLRAKQSPQVIPVDLSLNENTHEIETLQLNAELSVDAYSLVSLIAEKYRALFQQESRDRRRAQDVYDLALLINAYQPDGEEMLVSIRDAIRASCASRNIVATRELIDQGAVRRFAEQDYHALAATVEEELPGFDMIFETVSKFYQRLPW